jgi:DNA polymerase IV (DinB-like DNA polymerase)
MRIIMLVDMDYFYVACEELRHPQIRGVPAIVGSDPKEGRGRGVVMTCNYKARELGIHSAMPISAAYRLKPDAVFLGADFSYYDEVSAKVMAVLKRFCSKFEQVSVDEAFLDVSAKISGYGDAQQYASKMKNAVLEEVGIKCSVGIGPNKLIAKMACSQAKPDGIKVVGEQDVKDFLHGKKIIDLYGVGGKTSEKLAAMGYRTVEQLSKANAMQLIDRFGAFGGELIRYANGIDDSEVTENYGAKSISREFTFEKNTDDANQIKDAISRLSMQVGAEAEKGQEYFKTVTVKLRYYDFTEHLHSRSIRMTGDPKTLAHTAISLYESSANKSKKVRKLGVRVSNLVSRKGQKRITQLLF